MQAWASEVEVNEVFDVSETFEIPLLGVVAAGQPYQAFTLGDTLAVPTTLWGGKQVFALRVRGNSMVEEGIHNGDYLIVEPRATADNGQTVVAEVDGAVTVKKFYREADGAIRLQPANEAVLPLVVRGKQVRIVGIVTGILRKFGFGERASTPRAAAPAAPAGTARVPRPRPVAPPPDAASLELAVNVIDRQLVRWQTAIDHARHDRRLRRHLVRMEELGRDLQALRDWCARTRKPGLRRALVAEANTVMRRMQRFAALVPVCLPDLVLH